MLRFSRLYLLFIIFFFASCEKGIERMDNFLVDFATIKKYPDRFSLKLDDSRELIPNNRSGFSGNDGQRVVVNYTPLNNDTVKVNSISQIFTGQVENKGNAELVKSDKVKLQSVWVSGNYLNVVFESEYYERDHSLGLLQDSKSDDVNLYLVYSRNDDPPGYQRKVYASFSLLPINSDMDEDVTFTFFVDTHFGLQSYDLIYKSIKK